MEVVDPEVKVVDLVADPVADPVADQVVDTEVDLEVEEGDPVVDLLADPVVDLLVMVEVIKLHTIGRPEDQEGGLQLTNTLETQGEGD